MRKQVIIFVAAVTLLGVNMACGFLEREVAIEDTGLTITNFDNVPEASAGGGVEIASIDLSRLWEPAILRSYRSEFQLEIWFDDDAADPNASWLSTNEVTTDPDIQHIFSIQESEMFPEDMLAMETDMYIVDGVVYSKSSLFDEWTAFDGELADLLGDILINPQDYAILPEEAQRKSEPETVNGIPTWHYTFDETAFEEVLIEYEQVSTDVWIAVEGGFIVKLESYATGGDLTDDVDDNLFAGMLQNSRVRSTYNMKDINSDITLSLPAAAAAVEVTDLFGGLDFDSEWARDDVPFPADAEIDYSFTDTIALQSPASVVDVKNIMLPQMLSFGWLLEMELLNGEEYYLGDYSKGEEFLTLSIEKDMFDDDVTNIHVDIKRSVPWTRDDVVLPEDAHIDRSFEGELSVLTYLVIPEATDFIVSHLEANGWVLETVLQMTDSGYRGSFIKEPETLYLVIDPALDGQGRTRIEFILE